MDYLFVPAQKSDAEKVFSLIQDRIRWMDELGIEQWNKEDYWGVFPKSYYHKAIQENRLYVLKEPETAAVVSAGVLSFQDWRWGDDGTPAAYLHNFVTALHTKGIGGIFLKKCEEYIRLSGKKKLRLDCTESNLKLNQYYERHGYKAVGRVIDGNFIGIKREKDL